MRQATVVVTGAAKGIGRSMAIRFAEAGYNVVINYNHSEKKAKELSEWMTGKGYAHLLFKADITHRASVEKMMHSAIDAFGGIDVLINNAGISNWQIFSDVTESDWDQMMAVTLKGLYNCTQCALKTMVSEKEGIIINVSSMWGQVGASCEVAYSTAKAGVIGFTKALAKELGPSNIRVNCIAPGMIETDMMAGFSESEKRELIEEVPLMRIGLPEEVASCALFLASKASSYITGQVIAPNGGMVI